MSANCNSCGAYTLLLSLDVKFVNIFEKSTGNISILNVPFHILNNSHFNLLHILAADLQAVILDRF
jgi:hypothetical protein